MTTPKAAQGRVPWSVEDLREILNGSVADPQVQELLRTADRKGLSPVSFAALRAAATADSLTPLLELLEPPQEGEDRMEQMLRALEAVAERLDRIEAKVDALGRGVA